jgi:biotin carboxyl carrier protein
MCAARVSKINEAKGEQATMSKKFRITVNGETYEVEVEDLGGDAPVRRAPVAAAPVSTPTAAPVSAPQPTAAPKPAAPKPEAKPAAKPAVAGEKDVTAPMPGTILDVKVNVGDTVDAGSTVLILEAMKMENEIAAPAAGTVKAIHVSKGAAVNPGDVLISIE